jgi:16S rRNA (uracil1498-N3)-methyltransferase
VLANDNNSNIVLFCDEAEKEQSLRVALAGSAPESVMLIVGAEGGWTDEERRAAIDAGALPVSLGARILRTETAALVALSQVLYALESG